MSGKRTKQKEWSSKLYQFSVTIYFHQVCSWNYWSRQTISLLQNLGCKTFLYIQFMFIY